MKHRVSAVAVKLDGGVIRPGEMVVVKTDRYRATDGKFRGQFGNGKLAVTVKYGSYQQTFLVMSQFEIRASTQGGPVESAQFVGRVARLSRNVRQPDHVLANSFAGHKAEPRPGAGEEWLAMTKHDGMDVESILINQIKVGQAPCQVGSGYVDLPIQLGF